MKTARPSMAHGLNHPERMSPYDPNVRVGRITVLATIPGVALSDNLRELKYSATRRLTSGPNRAGSRDGKVTPTWVISDCPASLLSEGTAAELKMPAD